MELSIFLENCRKLLEAHKTGKLGNSKMPEDSNPGFNKNNQEVRIAYFSLPMALNYQRDSYKLWEAALKTFNDPETQIVFDVQKVSNLDEDILRNYLTKYKLALQPNKHIRTWQIIAKTVAENFGSFSKLMEEANTDFLKLQEIVQKTNKKGFPYLSGPKIFHYWSFILGEYANVKLKNKEYIEVAPDTHITKCSVVLNVITPEEAESLSKEEISRRWRRLLSNTEINPIDMHPTLWFWSRNGFIFKLK